MQEKIKTNQREERKQILIKSPPLAVVEVGRDSDNSVLNLMAQVGLGGLLHLGQHHRADLLRREHFLLVLVLDLELGQGAGVDDGEGPVLHVGLHRGVRELPTDQPLRVEDGVAGVNRHLEEDQDMFHKTRTTNDKG